MKYLVIKKIEKKKALGITVMSRVLRSFRRVWKSDVWKNDWKLLSEYMLSLLLRGGIFSDESPPIESIFKCVSYIFQLIMDASMGVIILLLLKEHKVYVWVSSCGKSTCVRVG